MLKKRLFGMVILIVGMTVFGCSGSNLNGTWVNPAPDDTHTWTYTFSGSNYEFVMSYNKSFNHKGTFSLDRKKGEITFYLNGGTNGDSYPIRISGNSFTIGTKTYTKK